MVPSARLTAVPEGPAADRENLRQCAGVRHRNRPALRASRRADGGELGLRQQQRLAHGRAILADRLGQQDRLVAVDQAGALLDGGTPRSVAVLVRICFTNAGRGRGAMVGLAIGLDDQCRGTGGQGRRLAGSAGFLDVGRRTLEVRAARIGRTGFAGGESEVAGCNEIDGSGRSRCKPPELRELMLSFSHPVVAK